MPCIGEVEICLNCNGVARVQESLDRQRWCILYGEAVGHACLQDDALCRMGKVVPSPCLSVRFVLRRDERVDGFRTVKPHHSVAEESCES